jgi:hypothetical protein
MGQSFIDCRTTEAVTFVRKLRGGTQAHLIKAADGRQYVVKFRNNPQGRRTLINEIIASALLKHLRLPTAEPTLVQLSPAFLLANPEIYIELGSRRHAVEAGWHYGSAHVSPFDEIAVYDFLPDALLKQLANPSVFLGALVFDNWVANTDARQIVFVRDKIWNHLPPSGYSPSRKSYIAIMIDHGAAFNGSQWEFVRLSNIGLYFRPLVYRSVTGWSDFEFWLEGVRDISESIGYNAIRALPEELMMDDRDALHALLERLFARRGLMAGLIERTRCANSALFPSWTCRT